MSILKTRFGKLPWIAKVAIGAASLILISAVAWLWVPRTSQEDTKMPPPDPTATAAHQKIIESIVPPIERQPNTTPVPAQVRAIRTHNGIVSILTVPIVRKENITDTQFINDTKEEASTILNTLFANDTTVQIVSVSTTYPRSDGRESIVLAVLMQRNAWQSAGKITSDNIAKIAQSFQVNKQYTP